MDLTPNPLSRAVRAHRAEGLPLLDLTLSNPTRAALDYDAGAVLDALRQPSSLVYEPDPLGLLGARQAVAEHYRARGVVVPPSQVLLTAGTSEAYQHLFRLLSDRGDALLIPEPSYPLLGDLAELCGVHLDGYPLRYDGRFYADPNDVYEAIHERTRAIIALNPNNPTGSYLTADDQGMLSSFGLPLIVDEVFHPFPLTDAPAGRRLVPTETLTFMLGGLSKEAALPQMKLAWTAVCGPTETVRAAMDRLEWMADAFLTPSAPVQAGLRELLAAGARVRGQIEKRTADNLARLAAATDGTPISLPRVEGGWYAPLRLPATRTDEAWALELLAKYGALVHPGYLFRFPSDEAWLVVSLLTDPDTFGRGIDALVRLVEA